MINFVFGFGLTVLVITLKVLTLSLYWDWFFSSLIPIEKPSLAHLYGISATITFLTYDSGLAREQKTYTESAFLSIFIISFFIFFGWIITWFV